MGAVDDAGLELLVFGWRPGERCRWSFQIMKLEDIRLTDIAIVPEIDRSTVTFLWFNDFHDGPLAGLAEMNGTRYLLDMIDRNVLGDEQEDRRYWLIATTEDQLSEEVRWHDLFCNQVGTHFDLTDRTQPSRESIDMDSFHAAYRKRVPPDYSQNDVVSWLRL
jgi:hypothetical protein